MTEITHFYLSKQQLKEKEINKKDDQLKMIENIQSAFKQLFIFIIMVEIDV